MDDDLNYSIDEDLDDVLDINVTDEERAAFETSQTRRRQNVISAGCSASRF